MERITNLQCKGNDTAVRACCTSGCKQPALMCNKSQCKCIEAHAQFLKSKIQNKKKSILPLIDSINEWYQNQIKQLLIMQDNFKALIQQNSYSSPDQAKLMDLLKNGKSSRIMPQMVSRAINSVSQNSQQPLQKLQIINCNSQLLNITKKLKLVLDDLAVLQKFVTKKNQSQPSLITPQAPLIKSQIITRFSESLHHNNIEIVNGSQAKVLNNTKNHDFKTALLQLPVEAFGKSNQLYKYKINSEYYCMFGFCYLKQAIEKKYLNNIGIDSGSFLFGYKGNNCIQIKTHDQQQPKELVSATQSYAKNIIHVSYFPNQQIVQFKNLRTNQTFEIKMKTIPGNQLYACIVKATSSYEIEFLGMQLID